MTTEAGRHRGPPSKRKRASKRTLRALSWIAGTAAFLSPWAILGISPRPVASAQTSPPRVIVRHRVVRRVVWLKPKARAKPVVRYVYVSGGGGGGTAQVSTGGSAP
jgi:hypothetical protein